MTLITSVSILFCAQTHDHHDPAPGDQNDTIQSPDCQNMTDIRDCENIAVYTHKQRRYTSTYDIVIEIQNHRKRRPHLWSAVVPHIFYGLMQ